MAVAMMALGDLARTELELKPLTRRYQEPEGATIRAQRGANLGTSKKLRPQYVKVFGMRKCCLENKWN
jgi:hypothetical protein